jgi:hypothetical protein
MQQLLKILGTFDPISLQEMDSVALLNRIDTKFTFHIDQLPVYLAKVAPHYRILEVKNLRLNKYETLYFDTDDFLLFLQHHNGKLNRYKVRYRCYLDTDLSFFEIKFKNNKDRTLKERIRRVEIEETIQNEAEDFLFDRTKMNAEDLSAKLWVYYSRLTLVNKTSPERLTIDVDLNFKNQNSSSSYPSLVIAEVKQGKACCSPFLNLMKDNHIRKDAISKYCFGVASLHENIKKNNFKYKLLSINKLCHA